MKAELRTHPKVRYHGARTWPPDWGGTYDGSTQIPLGEQGQLEDVSVAERDLIGPERLDLTITYGGRKHSGQVWVDDLTLVPRLYDVLKKHIGLPIQEIGQLEVDL